MSNALELPTILDLIAAPGLLEAFISRRGRALAVDAGAVQRLGAQCLQVLLAARAAWVADGMALALENPSDEFSATLELLGASPRDLTHEAQHDGPDLGANKELAA
ncbi:STAS domain-containing protein [Acidocella sp.]|uniref:STAS domain-containing protein n=1 Tax=Acidocella sp. TaxID=50710 RepID=UPI00261D33D6|nr:STAS domain-containing protein [Acidocella sp.]